MHHPANAAKGKMTMNPMAELAVKRSVLPPLPGRGVYLGVCTHSWRYGLISGAAPQRRLWRDDARRWKSHPVVGWRGRVIQAAIAPPLGSHGVASGSSP